MINLQDLLDDQDNLQVVMAGSRPNDLGPGEKIQFIKDMVLAAEDELHEMLGEVGWKPWATSRHINVDAFKGEWIDLFHFVMNLALVVDMDSEEIAELYDQKRLKNIQRMRDKYDGVSTKCPRCRREYTDEFVNCLPKDGFGRAYCSKDDYYIDSTGELA